MTLTSPRLGLSYIAPAQAQKHVTANETFTQLDTLVQLTIISDQLVAEPSLPEEGDTYILPAGATGPNWQALPADTIATFHDGGWRAISPKTGWRGWALDREELLVFGPDGWTQLTSASGHAETAAIQGAPVTELATLGVNTSSDTNNRLAVKSDSVLLSHDDQTPGTGDMRLFLNNAGPSQTASLLFQNEFSSRAEFGLLGNDDLTLNVSSNGTTFKRALKVDAQTSFVTTGASMGINRSAPADFWSGTGSNSAMFFPYGYLGSNGSFGLGLWYNGYRDNRGTWTSQAINGSDVGSGFELQASGCFVRFQRAQGSAFPAIRLRITEDRVSPGSDNLISSGDPSHRWAQVYAATGAINTSDARYKDIIGVVSDKEKAVAKLIFKSIVKYRWKASVSDKGKSARQHFGVMAQDVKAAFETEGLDPSAYGIWCEDRLTQLNDDPVEGVSEHNTALTRQGIRYDELLIFLMAALL